MPTESNSDTAAVLARAQGCLLGQCIGDALGTLVEFLSPEQIARRYPDGVRDMADGGAWNTIAGQLTDDSEMALMLARALIAHGEYDPEEARKGYVFWLNSEPFDVGNTIMSGLMGEHDPSSQANGAMMRISPLGVFGATRDLDQVAEWARKDAAITHVDSLCQQANALFAMAIAHAVRTGCSAADLYAQVVAWSEEMSVHSKLFHAVALAATSPPDDFVRYMGWVLIAFRNALWQLLHAESVEEAIVDTIMRGGDTDTNAAICGALLGAVHGRQAFPERWVETVLACRPQKGAPGVHTPRPEPFWPVDVLDLAEQLVTREFSPLLCC